MVVVVVKLVVMARTVPKTQCVDEKVNMVVALMVVVFQMVLMVSMVANDDVSYNRESGDCLGVDGIDGGGDKAASTNKCNSG